MKVQERMSRDVVTCRPNDNLAEAARRMWEQDCGCLVVIDEGARVVGVVTDRDICMCGFFEDARPRDLSVSQAMAPQVQTCRAEDSLEHALELMSTRQVRRLPVLDAAGKLCGLLSIHDILRAAERKGGPAPATLVHSLAQICTPHARDYACVVGSSDGEAVVRPAGVDVPVVKR